MNIIYQTAFFFFFDLLSLHYLGFALLFSHHYCYKNRILPFGNLPREKPLEFT